MTALTKDFQNVCVSLLLTFLIPINGLAQTPNIGNVTPFLPTRSDDVVQLAASAVRNALADGIHRQTLRIPLSDVMYGDKEEGFVADRAIGWQGGPPEALRYLSPMVSELLRRIRPSDETGGLPPKTTEQVLLDFDGSSLMTAECPSGPLGDVQALLQANTDDYYMKAIASIEEQFSDSVGKSKRLFLLINPAWRSKQSWGIFGAVKAQKQILDRYPTTFAVDQFIVKNEQMSRLLVYPNEWCVFVRCSNRETKYLGSFKDQPDYSQMEKLLSAQ